MTAIAQQSREAIPDLLGPDLPPHTESALALFWALHDTRGASQVGIEPITYTEMANYARLMRRRMTPLEVACVREADRAMLREVHERAELAKEAS